MLFLLTGDVQIGKTRWLQSVCEQLSALKVPVAGVLAPGVWRENGDGFEKLGIDNIMLPGNKRISFARREDLALQEGTYEGNSQAALAGLKWHIFDEGIAKVNSHFAAIRRDVLSNNSQNSGLLVIDELGQLELIRGVGLSNAVALLDGGPTRAFPHAVLIVRNTLCEIAEERFRPAWKDVRRISPDEASRQLIFDVLGLCE